MTDVMVDSEYVEMIGRNLGYFEQLLVSNEQDSFDMLDDNQDGFYKSIRVAATIPSMNARAASLFINSYTFIEQRGNYKKWARAAVRIANRFEDGDPYLRCRIISLLGLLQYEFGDMEKARTSFIASERLALACEDDAAVANAWYYRAVIDFHSHQPEKSIEWLTKARQIIDTLEQPLPFDLERLSGFIFNFLGVIRNIRDELDSALEQFKQARGIYSALSLDHHIVIVDMNVSNVFNKQGHSNKALNLLECVVATCKEKGLFVDEVRATLALAEAKGTLKQWSGSLEAVNQIDQIKLMKMGYLDLLANTKVALARYLAANNRSEEAILQVNEGISILRDSGSSLSLANATGALAEIYLNICQPDLAKKKFREAIEIAKRCGNDSRVMQSIAEFETGLRSKNVPV